MYIIKNRETLPYNENVDQFTIVKIYICDFGINKMILSFISQDVEWLASSLGNLKTYNQVLNSKYNHIDFLFGNDVNEMVYQPVLSLIHSAGATKAVDTDLSAMG